MYPRSIGWLAIAIGITVAGTALIGPPGLGWIDFHLGTSAITQFRGGEIVSLALVAPGLIATGGVWLHKHPLAPPLLMGLALYTSYTYTTVSIGQEYSLYEGNSERAFLLFTGLVLGGFILTIAGWMQLEAIPASVQSYSSQRGLAWIFLLLGAFFALAWLSQIVGVYRGEASEQYAKGPTLFWLIKFLDLALCIPAMIGTGIGLKYGNTTARKASFALAVFTSCLIVAVCAMSIAMQIQDDPDVSPIMTMITGAGTIILMIFTLRLLRAYSSVALAEQ